MSVTIKDIARVCNVSYSTVSRVLNEKYVRQSPRNERILSTARTLGYQPNRLAVQLVKKQANMIGLMIPDVANPHYSEITKNVEDAAFNAGYQLLLCNSDWDVNKEAMYRDTLVSCRVAGIIVMPVCDQSHIIFRGLDIPVVLLGSRTEEATLSSVVMDNVSASFRATEYLISLGHRKLAYIGRKVTNYTSADRVKGFELAAAKYQIAPNDAVLEVSDSYKLEGGYHIGAKLFDRPDPPTGIVAFSDFIAIGAIQAAEERGLRVGRDISIIGFDDISFSALTKINLTTITPSNQLLAQKALQIALEQAEDKANRPRTVVLEPKMIVRDTCLQKETV